MDSNGFRKLAYKNMRRVSTKTLSMRFLEKRGYHCDDTERKIRIGRMCRTVDLFNIGDAIALHPSVGILMIQSTTVKCVRDHVETMMNSESLRKWLSCGGKFELHAWEYGKGACSPTVLKRVFEATVCGRGLVLSVEEIDIGERYGQ